MNNKTIIWAMALWAGLVAVSSIAVMWGVAAILPRFQPDTTQTISNAEVTQAAWIFGSILVLIVVLSVIPKLRRQAVRLTGLCCVLALAVAPVVFVVCAMRADTMAQAARSLSDGAGLAMLSLIILGAGLLFGFLKNRKSSQPPTGGDGKPAPQS